MSILCTDVYSTINEIYYHYNMELQSSLICICIYIQFENLTARKVFDICRVNRYNMSIVGLVYIYLIGTYLLHSNIMLEY